MNTLVEKLAAVRDMFGPHSLTLTVEQMMRIRRILYFAIEETQRVDDQLRALNALAEKPAVIAAMRIDADPELDGLLAIAADVRRDEARQAALQAATPIPGTNVVTFPIASRLRVVSTDGDAA